MLASFNSSHFFNKWSGVSTLKKKRMVFKNIVGKGENAGNQHFLLFLKSLEKLFPKKSLLKFHLFSDIAFS